MTLYIRRIVNLEESDYWIVKRFARETGLGEKSFSAALRFIIREWQSLQDRPSRHLLVQSPETENTPS